MSTIAGAGSVRVVRGVSLGWAVARREYAAFFRVPLGWIVIALCLLLSGIVFGYGTLQGGEPASLRRFFSPWWVLMGVVTPAISMRLISEEIRTGTLEPLLASPVSEAAVVLGKFAAAVGFIATALAPTLLYVLILELLSAPEYGPIIAGYTGLMLMAGMYLSIGLLFSSLTGNQTLAFMSTLFVIIGLILLSQDAVAALSPRLPWGLGAVIAQLRVDTRLADFARGIVQTRHVVFFLSVTGMMLSLAALALRARRWR